MTNQNVNLKGIDTTGRLINQGDTLLIYTPEESKWTTEIADFVNDELYTIWETSVKRVSTPIRLIEPNHIVVLIRHNGVRISDLEIHRKKRLGWN